MIRRRMNWEIILVSISIGIIVLISLASTWMSFKLQQPGAIFPLIHGYIPDFYYYLSLMHQGMEGKLLVTIRYTSEEFSPQFIHTFYILLGMVARVTHLWLPTMYLVARIVGGATLLYMGYILSARLIPTRLGRLTAFALMIVGVPLWFRSEQVFRTWGDFWGGLDPLGRVTYLPHHAIANIFLIIAMLLLSRALESKKRTLSIAAGIASAVAAWANPAVTLLFFAVIAMFAVLRPALLAKRYIDLGIVIAISCIPLFWLNHLQQTVFPWTAYRDWERFQMYPIDAVGFLKVLGVSGIFAIVAIPLVISRKKALWDLVVGWFLVPFIGLLLWKYIPISNARYLQIASYIPTSLLATEGILQTVRVLGKKKFIKQIIVWVIAIVYIFTSVPSFVASFTKAHVVAREYSEKLAGYPSRDLMDSFSFLSINGKADEVVVAPEWISSIIPAFSNKRVMLGHPTLTYAPTEKQNDMNILYRFKDAQEVRRVITVHRVSLIWTDGTLIIPESYAGYRFESVYKNRSMEYFRVLQ